MFMGLVFSCEKCEKSARYHKKLIRAQKYFDFALLQWNVHRVGSLSRLGEVKSYKGSFRAWGYVSFTDPLTGRQFALRRFRQSSQVSAVLTTSCLHFVTVSLSNSCAKMPWQNTIQLGKVCQSPGGQELWLLMFTSFIPKALYLVFSFWNELLPLADEKQKKKQQQQASHAMSLSAKDVLWGTKEKRGETASAFYDSVETDDGLLCSQDNSAIFTFLPNILWQKERDSRTAQNTAKRWNCFLSHLPIVFRTPHSHFSFLLKINPFLTHSKLFRKGTKIDLCAYRLLHCVAFSIDQASLWIKSSLRLAIRFHTRTSICSAIFKKKHSWVVIVMKYS